MLSEILLNVYNGFMLCGVAFSGDAAFAFSMVNEPTSF